MRKMSSRSAALSAMTLFSVPALAEPRFLNFPVTGYGPFTSGIMTSVLDHEVPHNLNQTSLPFNQPTTAGPYGYSGGILSFTGELFLASSPTFPNQNLGCYPKPTNPNQTSTWRTVVASAYVGTTGCGTRTALNYDNHPGYDYRIPGGTDVHPAASGHIISTRCIRTFTNTGTCESYGAVAVDHGNGFVTQYLHMANRNYGSAANGVNQAVTTSWTLGRVSNVGVTAVHLHFEVLQRKATPVNPTNYYDRSNYMIVDPYGYRTASYYADLLQSKPGCLWLVACQY